MNNPHKHTATGLLQKGRHLRIPAPRRDAQVPQEAGYRERPRTALGHPARQDWSRKDCLAWGLILAAAFAGLLVLWAPLMLTPLSEMAGAFIRLHHGS